MSAKYEPENGTVRDFNDKHPPGGDEHVEIGDLVTIPDGPSGVWEVKAFHGDFAQLSDPAGVKRQAWRRGRLKPVVKE